MMARSVPAPVEPAPPEAAVALAAALDGIDFGLATPFQRRGNIMAAPDTLAAAAMMTRPRPRSHHRAVS